jgi:SAM-dependent methyltransferase
VSYSITDYVAMIGDPVRTGAYVRALRKMVTPDSVVLDLGAGFGFFAVLAARLGARHAYAIEPDEAISLGPALARANGVADRVTFFHGDARQVTLPERANVLIEDVRGVMPLHAERIRVLCDARERLLTSDARRVALRDHIWAAPARHPAAVQSNIETAGADAYGIDLRSVRTQVVDGCRRARPKPEDLLLPGSLLGTLDLGIVSEPSFEGTARWTVDAPLVVDGFAVWFDAELSEGERFSAAPGPEQTMHGCLYLPLREPLSVPSRAKLALRFCAVQVAGDYAWTWESSVTNADGGGLRRTPRQSTLAAFALTKARLAAMSELHRPSLGPEGRRWRDAIALIDGQHSSREIANALARTGDFGCASESEAFDWLQGTLQVLESGAATKL